jgi:AbrB family looped-hinge helix DNA binding protein
VELTYQLTLPKEIADELGVKHGDKMKVMTDGRLTIYEPVG